MKNEDKELAAGSTRFPRPAPEQGLAMDQAIHERIMQGAPQFSWEIFNADETGSAIGFEREAEAIKWLDERPSMKDRYHVGRLPRYPHYSTDITEAMRVVACLQARDRYITIRAWLEIDERKWKCSIFALFGGEVESEVCESAELAICRAALLLVSSEQKVRSKLKSES